MLKILCLKKPQSGGNNPEKSWISREEFKKRKLGQVAIEFLFFNTIGCGLLWGLYQRVFFLIETS